MSPTEDQLRRALREGEGSGPDPTGVMLRATAYRRERRTKILSTVAIVAVVAGIGSGVGVIAANSGGSETKSSSNGGSGLTNGSADQAGGGTGEGAKPASGSSAPAEYPVATPCPDRLPSLGHGPFSHSLSPDSRFFSSTKTAGTVTVCGYLGTGVIVRDAASTPLAHVYSGAEATAITASVDATSAAPSGAACGAIPAAGLHSLLVFTTYTAGGAAMPVRIGLGCDIFVTNGRTMRYQWHAPEVLQPFLRSLQTAAGASASGLPAPATS